MKGGSRKQYRRQRKNLCPPENSELDFTLNHYQKENINVVFLLSSKVFKTSYDIISICLKVSDLILIKFNLLIQRFLEVLIYKMSFSIVYSATK